MPRSYKNVKIAITMKGDLVNTRLYGNLTRPQDQALVIALDRILRKLYPYGYPKKKEPIVPFFTEIRS